MTDLFAHRRIASYAGLSVLDLAADTFALRDWDARVSFLQTYYAFRHENPIIGPVLGVLLLLLPVVFYAMFTEDVLGLWRRPQHRARHVWGSIGFFGIIAIVSFTLACVRPAEDALLGLPETEASASSGAAAGRRLWALHAGVASFNAFMIVQPFFKYAADAAAPPPAAATAAAGGSAGLPAAPSSGKAD